MRLACIVLLAGWLGAAFAVEPVEVCFNYGCASRVEVRLADERLAPVARLLANAVDADGERAALARAIGMMQGLAAEQTPIGADRAGNFGDDGVDGRMDCIDHSTTTTHFLEFLAARGWLRFHRVLAPERRTPFFVFQHFSAVIEEIAPPAPSKAANLAPPVDVPDHVPIMLALCDCAEVLADLAEPQVSSEAALPVAHPGERFAVDSWFVDHGEPAVVLPLADWLNGEGPNVQ